MLLSRSRFMSNQTATSPEDEAEEVTLPFERPCILQDLQSQAPEQEEILIRDHEVGDELVTVRDQEGQYRKVNEILNLLEETGTSPIVASTPGSPASTDGLSKHLQVRMGHAGPELVRSAEKMDSSGKPTSMITKYVPASTKNRPHATPIEKFTSGLKVKNAKRPRTIDPNAKFFGEHRRARSFLMTRAQQLADGLTPFNFQVNNTIGPVGYTAASALPPQCRRQYGSYRAQQITPGLVNQMTNLQSPQATSGQQEAPWQASEARHKSNETIGTVDSFSQEPLMYEFKLTSEGPKERFEVVDLARLQYDRNTKRKFESFLQKYEPATGETLAKKFGPGNKNKAFETIMDAVAWRKRELDYKKERMMSQAVIDLLGQYPLPIRDPTPEQLAHGVEGYTRYTGQEAASSNIEVGMQSFTMDRRVIDSQAQDTERFRSRMSRITEKVRASSRARNKYRAELSNDSEEQRQGVDSSKMTDQQKMGVSARERRREANKKVILFKTKIQVQVGKQLSPDTPFTAGYRPPHLALTGERATSPGRSADDSASRDDESFKAKLQARDFSASNVDHSGCNTGEVSRDFKENNTNFGFQASTSAAATPSGLRTTKPKFDLSAKLTAAKLHVGGPSQSGTMPLRPARKVSDAATPVSGARSPVKQISPGGATTVVPRPATKMKSLRISGGGTPRRTAGAGVQADVNSLDRASARGQTQTDRRVTEQSIGSARSPKPAVPTLKISRLADYSNRVETATDRLPGGKQVGVASSNKAPSRSPRRQPNTVNSDRKSHIQVKQSFEVLGKSIVVDVPADHAAASNDSHESLNLNHARQAAQLKQGSEEIRKEIERVMKYDDTIKEGKNSSTETALLVNFQESVAVLRRREIAERQRELARAKKMLAKVQADGQWPTRDEPLSPVSQELSGLVESPLTAETFAEGSLESNARGGLRGFSSDECLDTQLRNVERNETLMEASAAPRHEGLRPVRVPKLEYQLQRKQDGKRTAVGGKRQRSTQPSDQMKFLHMKQRGSLAGGTSHSRRRDRVLPSGKPAWSNALTVHPTQSTATPGGDAYRNLHDQRAPHNRDLLPSAAGNYDTNEAASFTNKRGSNKTNSILKPLRALAKHLKAADGTLAGASSALSSSDVTGACHAPAAESRLSNNRVNHAGAVVVGATNLRLKSRGGTPHTWRKRPGPLKVPGDHHINQDNSPAADASSSTPKEFVPFQLSNNIVRQIRFQPSPPPQTQAAPSFRTKSYVIQQPPKQSTGMTTESSPSRVAGAGKADGQQLGLPNPFPDHVIVQVDESNSGQDQMSRGAEGQETQRTAEPRGRMPAGAERSLSHGSSINVMDNGVDVRSAGIARVATHQSSRLGAPHSLERLLKRAAMDKGVSPPSSLANGGVKVDRTIVASDGSIQVGGADASDAKANVKQVRVKPMGTNIQSEVLEESPMLRHEDVNVKTSPRVRPPSPVPPPPVPEPKEETQPQPVGPAASKMRAIKPTQADFNANVKHHTNVYGHQQSSRSRERPVRKQDLLLSQRRHKQQRQDMLARSQLNQTKALSIEDDQALQTERSALQSREEAPTGELARLTAEYQQQVAALRRWQRHGPSDTIVVNDAAEGVALSSVGTADPLSSHQSGRFSQTPLATGAVLKIIQTIENSRVTPSSYGTARPQTQVLNAPTHAARRGTSFPQRRATKKSPRLGSHIDGMLGAVLSPACRKIGSPARTAAPSPRTTSMNQQITVRPPEVPQLRASILDHLDKAEAAKRSSEMYLRAEGSELCADLQEGSLVSNFGGGAHQPIIVMSIPQRKGLDGLMQPISRSRRNSIASRLSSQLGRVCLSNAGSKEFGTLNPVRRDPSLEAAAERAIREASKRPIMSKRQTELMSDPDTQ